MKKQIVIVCVLAITLIGAGTLYWYYGNQQQTPPIVQNNPQNNIPAEPEIPLKDKIGQMIMLGFRGTQVQENSQTGTMIRDLNIGGIILFDYDTPSKSFPRNIQSPAQTKKLISDLQSYAKTPLLVSVDAEGGMVNRLKPKYGFKTIASAQTMGNDQTLQTTTTNYETLAEELHELGFNLDFAPVVDVNVNPQNPVIGGLQRSFSANPEVVANHAEVAIKTLAAQHIIAVAKHFPGHGSSTGDSHLGLVDVTTTYQQQELLPYQLLQQKGQLDMVMTAHIVNTAIDTNHPATLSPKFLQDILRNQIGFGGVIISDDMQMGAIVANYGFKEAIIRAINAGCDMLLLSNNGTAPYDSQLAQKAIDIIYQAVQEGSIPENTITDSYNRIQTLKKKYQIID